MTLNYEIALPEKFGLTFIYNHLLGLGAVSSVQKPVATNIDTSTGQTATGAGRGQQNGLEGKLVLFSLGATNNVAIIGEDEAWCRSLEARGSRGQGHEGRQQKELHG